MRIKLDESLPAELAEDLAALGHEVDTVRGEGLAGAPDTRVAAMARSADRVLLTLDKGLGDIRRYPPKQYPGIVVFRLDQKGRGAVRRAVNAIVPKIAKRSLRGRLVVATPSTIRIR